MAEETRRRGGAVRRGPAVPGRIAALVGLGLAALAAPAEAAPLDGTAPILCALMTVVECDSSDCEWIRPQDAGLPPFLQVDVPKQVIRATDAGGRSAPIRSAERAAGRLILQGGQGTRGFSVVIAEDSGEMSAAIVGHDGVFAISGVCTTSGVVSP